MPEPRMIEGGSKTDSDLPIEDQVTSVEFGMPSDAFAALLSTLLGAAAGLISLVCYFYIRDPALYIKPDWLIFIAAGAVVGFFLRIERPIRQYRFASKIK